MPTIKIDDVEYDVEAGQNLIQAAASVGITIPHYCYHPGLSVSGNCRMCLVEQKGPRGIMATIACNTFVNDGMEFLVDNDNVKKMRQGVMEFLLLNHPIDCPICDQAGECGLQDYYMDYGLYTNRSTVPKVHKAKAVDVGPLVKLDQERCILCSRCVRFCEEITGTHELVITQRGEKSRIETFPGRELDNPYSANVVDICPVGALTSKDFRFKKRVWFLSTTQSICTGCAKGCNTYLDFEQGTTYRYRPRFNADVNEWWMCDEGRLSYKALHQDRLDIAMQKGAELPLAKAVTTAAGLIQRTMQDHGKNAVLAVASSTVSLEDNFMLKHLMFQALGSEAVHSYNYDHMGEADAFLRLADKTPNTAGLQLLNVSTEQDTLETALANPEVKLVISLDADSDALRQQLKDKQVIYLGVHQTVLALDAEITLPITAHAEHDASYINAEQRLQKVNQAYFPTTEARPAWKLIAGLFAPLLTAPPLYDDVEDVWSLMNTKVDVLSALTFYEIPDTGRSLLPSTEAESDADAESPLETEGAVNS